MPQRSEFWPAGDVERELAAAEAPRPTPPDPILAPFDREHAWRAKGEWAIRAEMEKAVRRRLAAARGCAA